MLKKTITYSGIDGREYTEDFLFALTKADLMEMEVSTPGGMQEYIQRISQTQDIHAVLDLFKDLIAKSYGQKSPDGKRFIRSKALTEEFMQTEAYDKLLMEIFSDENAAAAFVSGILPQDIAAQAATMLENQKNGGTVAPVPTAGGVTIK